MSAAASLGPSPANEAPWRGWLVNGAACVLVLALALMGGTVLVHGRRPARCEEAVHRWLEGCLLNGGQGDLAAGFDFQSIGAAAGVGEEAARRAFYFPCALAGMGRTTKLRFEVRAAACPKPGIICANEVHSRNGVDLPTDGYDEYGFVCRDGLIVEAAIVSPDPMVEYGKCSACQWP